MQITFTLERSVSKRLPKQSSYIHLDHRCRTSINLQLLGKIENPGKICKLSTSTPSVSIHTWVHICIQFLLPAYTKIDA